jgi:hypothetical protein
MVGEDGPPARTLDRGQRVAAEVVRRFDLSPPIDVHDVLERFADLEEDDIPGACDGLVVGLHGGRRRPLVLVDRTQADVRQRFTIAHELGHILLPWHIGGAFLCETGAARGFDVHGDVVDPEPEANRFAAELLVPAEWLLPLVVSLGTASVSPLMEEIRAADVSAYVACLRLLDVLPTGHAFCVTAGGFIRMTGQTRGTGVLPFHPRDLDRARLDQWAQVVEDISYGPAQVTWWTYRGETTVTEYAADPRSWRDVLSDLLDRHAPVEPERGKTLRSLNGVIAAANGVAKREGISDPAALYVRFRGRFAKARALPETLLHDPDFDVLLHKRAETLGQR